ncbi:MAG: T9SS type A sorting domain-containing protein [Chitinophagaceae bacterium]|nr:T9SS type A sorting domain-containing protein [Chitinophagaceae bacterium]
MTLFNLPGNKIIESLKDQSMMTFDVSHLPDGIYFVIISDEKSRFVKKVFIGA